MSRFRMTGRIKAKIPFTKDELDHLGFEDLAHGSIVYLGNCTGKVFPTNKRDQDNKYLVECSIRGDEFTLEEYQFNCSDENGSVFYDALFVARIGSLNIFLSAEVREYSDGTLDVWLGAPSLRVGEIYANSLACRGVVSAID